MPANLPPQYYELEREFAKEKDPRERLRLAEELLRIMPKHKGTDHLQADMKTKIAKLRKMVEAPRRVSGTRQVTAHDFVEREGAGQVILIGPPNTGKSSLVDVLTHAHPAVGDYPYTTREPLAGMMPFESIQIQLIDTPPISSDHYENYLGNLIRNADLVLLVCDLTDAQLIENTDTVIRTLEEKHIVLQPKIDSAPEDPRFKYQKTIICAHKAFEDGSVERLAALAARFGGFRIVPTSILDDSSLDHLKRAIFEALEIMRVYTKQIGKEVDPNDPVVLPLGGTVEDAANVIHKDFGQKLKFAKVWGKGKFDGQRVKSDYVLTDGDIVEFHI
ncbi:MAG: GTPase [Candidatus Zixiibacteriota bacterium]